MKRMLFIYNPKAGKGEIRMSLSYILEEFSGNGYEVVVHPTAASKDATRVVQECGDNFDLIVCSGGDGTLDEVVTGMQTGRFSRPLGAARSIMNGSVFDCDLGRLNDSYFVYVAAFGAFVDVSYDTPQDMKNALGHVAYLLRGVQSLAAIKTYNMHFESAEMSGTGNFILGMITNSNSVGGFKGITGRDVTLNDGMFEVTLVRMPGMAAVDIPAMVNAVLTGTPNRYIVTFKTARLELWFDQEISWTRDGEFGGNHRHVVIENLARALPIVVPTETEEETPELEANLF